MYINMCTCFEWYSGGLNSGRNNNYQQKMSDLKVMLFENSKNEK